MIKRQSERKKYRHNYRQTGKKEREKESLRTGQKVTENLERKGRIER